MKYAVDPSQTTLQLFFFFWRKEKKKRGIKMKQDMRMAKQQQEGGRS